MPEVGQYLKGMPNTDTARIYESIESPDGDGWIIAWRTQYGDKHHPVKKLGTCDTVEQADQKLREYACTQGMEEWIPYPEPTKHGQTGCWERVKALPVEGEGTSNVELSASSVELVGDAACTDSGRNAGELRVIAVSSIIAGRNPRTEFDMVALGELADSIAANGVIEPIVVRPIDDNYEIIAGERRWRASQMAGLTEIPCVVRFDLEDRDAMVLALEENLRRRDLNPFEVAEGIQALLEMGVTQKELEQKLGMKQSTISNKTRLLNLPASVREHVSAGRFSEAHAKALLQYVDYPGILQAYTELAVKGLGSKDIEKMQSSQIWDFERQGLVKRLDCYPPPFAHKEVCNGCNDRRNCGYAVCLKPECFTDKVKEAAQEKLRIEAEKSEAVRKQLECEDQLPTLRDLGYDNYRELGGGQGFPPGCKKFQCDRRKMAKDSSGALVAICIDMKCYRGLTMKGTRDKNKVRRQMLDGLLGKVVEKVRGDTRVDRLAYVAMRGETGSIMSVEVTAPVLEAMGLMFDREQLKGQGNGRDYFWGLVLSLGDAEAMLRCVAELAIRHEIRNARENDYGSPWLTEWYLGKKGIKTSTELENLDSAGSPPADKLGLMAGSPADLGGKGLAGSDSQEVDSSGQDGAGTASGTSDGHRHCDGCSALPDGSHCIEEQVAAQGYCVNWVGIRT